MTLKGFKFCSMGVSVCVLVCVCMLMQDVDGQDMADRLLNSPLMKFTINKKDVITSVSKCDCNETVLFQITLNSCKYFKFDYKYKYYK